ncbi:MAG: hypothetical protein VKO21_11530 [Candidatus Sericytochromatia bacterium]|nr:hypothetical protein [Candidatus Sericytochromatia bacterium]
MISDDQRVTPGARPARLPREAMRGSAKGQGPSRPALTGPMATDQLTVQPIGGPPAQATGDIRNRALEAIRHDIEALGQQDPVGQGARILELAGMLPPGDPVRLAWLARLSGSVGATAVGGPTPGVASPSGVTSVPPDGLVALPSFDTAARPAPSASVTSPSLSGAGDSPPSFQPSQAPPVRAGGEGEGARAPEALLTDLDSLLTEQDNLVASATDLGSLAKALDGLSAKITPIWQALLDAAGARPDLAPVLEVRARRLKELGIVLPAEGKGGNVAENGDTAAGRTYAPSEPGTLSPLGPLTAAPSSPPSASAPIQAPSAPDQAVVPATPAVPLLVDPTEDPVVGKEEAEAREQLAKMLPRMNAGQVERLPRQTLEAASGEQLATMAKLLVDHWRLKDSNRVQASYLLRLASGKGRVDTMLRTLDRMMGHKGIDKLMDSLKGTDRARAVDSIFRDLQRTNLVGSDVLQKVAIQLNKDDIRLLLDQRGSSRSSSWFRALPAEVKSIFHDTLKRGGFGKTSADQTLLAELAAG